MESKKIHDPFADDDEADAFAASFAPAPSSPSVADRPAQEVSSITAADSVAADQGFTSRKRRKASKFKRSDNFRTGRNVPITIKARAEDKACLEKMASERQRVNGQTLQYALDALQEKIDYPQNSFWKTHNFHGVD